MVFTCTPFDLLCFGQVGFPLLLLILRLSLRLLLRLLAQLVLLDLLVLFLPSVEPLTNFSLTLDQPLLLILLLLLQLL